MKIGIISDTHDNIENVRKVILRLEEMDCEALIHCGDFCAPFIIVELSKFKGDSYCCFGNTDDRFLSTNNAKEHNVNLLGDLGELGLDGKKIAFTHLPKFAEGLAATGEYDVVFHGHTHQSRNEKIGETLLVNPGEIMGYKNKPSFAVYDTTDNSVGIFEL